MNIVKPVPAAEFERQKLKARGFVVTNTSTIMATEYPPIRWVVGDYVPEGLSILAGRQKLGKTWLALDWAIAVASGGAAMGAIYCGAGDVLYIDLENGPRRMQARIKMLFPGARNRPDLSRLNWVNDAPELNMGFISALDDWRKSAIDPKLVIIDVLQRVKPTGKANQNSYESDYDAMSSLQRWATDRRIGVVCLHHTRKGGADDPLEALSGSNGLSACADTTLLLDRDQNGITLYVRGRDVEEKETALRFAGGYWTIVGEAAEVRRSEGRNTILDVLRGSTVPMSPSDVAGAVGKPSTTIKKMMFVMAKAGEIERTARGLYQTGGSR
jgi:RecA-family ATPase